jgi:hypothetical protein
MLNISQLGLVNWLSSQGEVPTNALLYFDDGDQSEDAVNYFDDGVESDFVLYFDN